MEGRRQKGLEKTPPPDIKNLVMTLHCCRVGCVAQWKNVGLSSANFPVLSSTCSWWLTTYVGKPFAVGRPTRPTQPFILSGSTNWVVSWYRVCATSL